MSAGVELVRSVPPRTAPVGTNDGWLLGPLPDALFIANLGWPLILALNPGEGFGSQDGLRFWQVYFITAPHRWATLLLVFLDRDRFSQRGSTFLAVAALVIVGCLAVRMTTGTLLCLMTLDYLWNAWHFAAQHHGIYVIYDRQCEPKPRTGQNQDRWAFRLFLLYVILRVATATTPLGAIEPALRWADRLVLLVPLLLITRDLVGLRWTTAGRFTYLVSVCLLYASLLLAVHARWFPGVLALTLASALFHATEYLTLVGWSVKKRHAALGQRMGLLGYLAPRWGLTLMLFLLILGVGGWALDQDPEQLRLWLTINVMVAFLHYAYDGLIWRRQTR